MFRIRYLAGACLCGFACIPSFGEPALAQGPSGATQLPPVVVEAQKPRRVAKKRTQARPVARAPAAPAAPRTTLTVTPAAGIGIVAGPAPVKQTYQLPQTSEGITRQKIEQTINAVDTEDAVKYMPSLFVRKRNAGDNQAVLATRNWGLSSSARSLIYADDILLSALIGNNNGNAAPRWGMVAPEEIERIDFLYGPFAAMYPGNSIGGVLAITTRMPDKPEFNFKQTEAFQSFNFYNTSGTYRTDQTSASFGNRWNALSGFLSANFQNSNSQPLNWITTAGTPAGTTGTIPQLSRAYTTANVIGSGGLLHTDQGNLKGKFALDVTDWLKATYTVGFFDNEQQSRVQSYLRDVNGNPTFGGNATVGGSGFAAANYNLSQQQLANAFTLKTDTRGSLDGELVVTRFDYLKDIQRNPFTVAAAGLAFTDVGKITRLDGTNWTTVDAKGIWRSSFAGRHEVSFGVHGDQYELVNPVYQTPNWQSGTDATNTLYANSAGKTQTLALWAQDAWRFVPDWKLTVGGRFENWRAFDGFNLNTTTSSTTGAITSTTAVTQPQLEAARFSPKASLAWEPTKEWQVTASVGVANRFPTVTELYQTSTTPGVLVLPNPNLRPEQALATELSVERKFADGKVRLSLFQDDTRDALISQANTVAGTTTVVTSVTNVDKVRSRGAELAWQKDNVAIAHLELFGSITYVDARILSDPNFVPTVGIPTSSAIGRRVPNVPEWRSTLGATYRPTEQWAFTVAGRWQSKTFSTIDNIDTNPNVYQAFDAFVVVDAKVQYKVSQNGTLNFGVDNIFNEQYHLFHPFPQRTFVASGKVTF
jgi:iron complex outermembrane receptor protein